MVNNLANRFHEQDAMTLDNMNEQANADGAVIKPTNSGDISTTILYPRLATSPALLMQAHSLERVRFHDADNAS
jgi:hypothetical protein